MSPPPALLSDDDLMSAVAEVETRARALHGQRLALLAEVLRRGLDLESYRHSTRVDRARLRRWTAQVRLFLGTLSATGQPLEPAHPIPAEVWPELSEEHLAELARAVSLRLPPGSQEILVRAACAVEPRAVRLLAEHIRDRTARDEADERDEHAARGDVLHLRHLPGGRLELWGELSAETGAKFTALLYPLAAPLAGERDAAEQGAAERGAAERGAAAPRNRAERQGEAFADLLELAEGSGRLPSEAGERPHISVTVGFDALRRGTGHARLDDGRHLSAAQARRLACDAKVIPVVLGGRSEVLDLGRARRTVSLAQRRALHARHGGCAFPGCHRPSTWCDAHHVRHWADGGPTDLDNLVLLCRRHHTLVHHTEWRITLVDGVPAVIPPRHVDPAQRPRQNLLHRQPTRHAA
ncbi:hypothetical protein JOF41_003801 [Saccharothrix coeruleofusca]|uniref:HNH endonuclease signature motif containing protein n=1 Tax=Saccharothrix coeruleofusca TaxID=33919 RepID=UPI001AE726BF|nr:HNH endonuclease signature motif containing protein [Saccharothrix coeruleofusca]MBP2337623.1 hypothetical protein [Saccharothrix coeruleofusca]